MCMSTEASPNINDTLAYLRFAVLSDADGDGHDMGCSDGIDEALAWMTTDVDATTSLTKTVGIQALYNICHRPTPFRECK